jgi:hypothetical protein
MLGQHPETYGFPELRLFNADTLGGALHFHEQMLAAPEQSRSRDPVIVRHALFFKAKEQGRPPARFSDGLLRAVAELVCGGQTDRGIGEADAWLRGRLDWPVGRVYDLLLDSVAPRVGVDKSPHTGMSPPAMERVRHLYPGARFLHLTRHPTPTLKSMQEFFKREFQRTYPGGDPRELAAHCAHLWRLTHRGILDFTAVLPPEQTLRVRGEDLLADPDAHLARIARWLGLRDDGPAVEAMKHPEASPYAKAGPEAARLGNDPKFLAGPRLRPVSVPESPEPPADLVPDADLRRSVADLAARLGYGGAAGGPTSAQTVC